jgi:ATP adenylyltransferase
VFAHRSRHRTPSVARSNIGNSPGPAAAASAAVRTSTSRPRRWITSSLKTTAAQTTSINMGVCFRCNAGKRNSENTDLLSAQAVYVQRQDGCVFCELDGSRRVLLENELAICIPDAFPERECHSLEIPVKNVGGGLFLLKRQPGRFQAQDAFCTD